MQKQSRIRAVILNILVILIGTVVFSSCSPKDAKGAAAKMLTTSLLLKIKVQIQW